MECPDNHWQQIYIDKSLSEVNNMNNTLRSQRHDFLNHMQVIYSLIKMSKFDETRKYIERLYCEISETNAAIRTGIIELDALFLAKISVAKQDDINLTYDVSSSLSALNIPAFELVKIVGNLLDNAIFAARKSTGAKLAHVHIYEDSVHYILSITNTGPEIKPEIQDKIFQPGFSTKTDNGEGLGLFIAKTLLEKYKAQIHFKSSKVEGTNFMVFFPKAFSKGSYISEAE